MQGFIIKTIVVALVLHIYNVLSSIPVIYILPAMDFWQFIKNKLTPWSVLKPGVAYDIMATPSNKLTEEQQETQILYDDKLAFLNENYTEEKEALDLYPKPTSVQKEEQEQEEVQVEEEPTPHPKEETRVSSSQLRKIYHAKQSLNNNSRIGPSNYSAIQIHGFFGCIDLGTDIDHGHIRNLIIHTSKRLDTSHMLSLAIGDTIHIVYIASRTKGLLKIRYVTRSKYFSPGSPVTSIKVGVEGWEPDM
jgi:hypothetical protein